MPERGRFFAGNMFFFVWYFVELDRDDLWAEQNEMLLWLRIALYVCMVFLSRLSHRENGWRTKRIWIRISTNTMAEIFLRFAQFQEWACMLCCVALVQWERRACFAFRILKFVSFRSMCFMWCDTWHFFLAVVVICFSTSGYRHCSHFCHQWMKWIENPTTITAPPPPTTTALALFFAKSENYMAGYVISLHANRW